MTRNGYLISVGMSNQETLLMSSSTRGQQWQQTKNNTLISSDERKRIAA